MGTSNILYPYLPESRKIKYVDSNNEFIVAARAFAKEASLDDKMPNASVIVYKGKIVGKGANGSNYHKEHGCERVRQNIPTGQGYELCEGCHPKNHSEPQAIAEAQTTLNSQNLSEADLYLWGHWWCCEPCWNAMNTAHLRDIYLLKDSEKLFNKDHADNVIDRQFNYA